MSTPRWRGHASSAAITRTVPNAEANGSWRLARTSDATRHGRPISTRRAFATEAIEGLRISSAYQIPAICCN
jgi:hypothetical protein